MDAQLRVLLAAAGLAALMGAAQAAEPAPPAPPPSQTFGSTPKQRETLRHCAAEWSRMKRSGAAAGKLWRDFWAACGKG